MLISLTNYIDSLEKKIKETLPGVFDLDEEAIHDFRVSLKKLRTVLNFLDYWSYGQTSKRPLMIQFKPIFKKTGRIRELQIHKSLVPIMAELSGLEIDFLDKKINYQIIRNKKYLKQIVKAFEKKIPGIFRNIHKQISSAGKGKTRIDAAATYQVRLGKRIQKQVNSAKADLHQIRKTLKQKVYIFDSLQESELLSFYKEFRAEWKIMESTMGVWHDQKVFRIWLIPGLKWKRLNDQQYKAMIKLITYLRRTTDRMERELVKAMRGK